MSSFNKPYRDDKAMKADAELQKKQRNIKNRKKKNKLAQDIFNAVLEEIEGKTTDFSKDEMIAFVRGESKYSNDGEKMVWHNACTIAIQCIRRYFWTDHKDSSLRRMFNYVYADARYYLIDVTDELKANIVFESYDRKMKGIAMKQTQIATSAYNKVLELDEGERQKLIKKLLEELKDEDA